MNAKPVWAFAAVAFEASRRDSFPRALQGAFVQLGVASFWVALALEGRAWAVWRDQRALAGGARFSPLPGWYEIVDRVKQLLARQGGRGGMLIAAWSLPDSTRMRGLGLGRVWAVLCPYCQEFHTHTPGEGRRTPHCCSDQDRKQYVLEYAGALPLEHRARFYRSSKTDLPRLLRHWPETGHREHGVELLAA
jgi:hypothetical protein